MKLAIALGLAVLGTVQAISQIEIYGNKFFDSDGNQFFMKGVAYQLVSDDPLVDTEQCKRDATLMQTLGANSIRVYHVDPDADHSGCMSAFEDAGIYLLVDLDTFNTYILPEDPYWNSTQYAGYTKVMDEFVQFDNTLGFFVGNEVIAMATQSNAAPFIKAAARDLKAYRDSKGYRQIPVGYSAADIAELRPMLQDYLTCGGNASETIDFFSLNSYEWCGAVTFETSGYTNLQAMAVDYPVPLFFSETGCNAVKPRTFGDQAAIFGPEMVNDWSGALIYEWIEETNDYGLVSYGPQVDPTATGTNIIDGFTRSGTPTPVNPDFSNLQSAWAAITPTGVAKSNYDTASLSTRACPTSTAGTLGWLVNGNIALPSIGETLGSSTFSASPTSGSSASGTSSSSSASSSSTSSASTANPASPSTKITGVCAALMSVMLLFTLWL